MKKISEYLETKNYGEVTITQDNGNATTKFIANKGYGKTEFFIAYKENEILDFRSSRFNDEILKKYNETTLTFELALTIIKELLEVI